MLAFCAATRFFSGFSLRAFVVFVVESFLPKVGLPS
jgi:hypothetical protein